MQLTCTRPIPYSLPLFTFRFLVQFLPVHFIIKSEPQKCFHPKVIIRCSRMSDLFRSVLNGSGSDPLVGSTVEAGQYRLQVKSKIAEGGFACIYQATNESSGETLAVKRLLSNDAERKQDAIREASLLRKMNHKNIVKFVTGNFPEFSEISRFFIGTNFQLLKWEITQRDMKNFLWLWNGAQQVFLIFFVSVAVFLIDKKLQKYFTKRALPLVFFIKCRHLLFTGISKAKIFSFLHKELSNFAILAPSPHKR